MLCICNNISRFQNQWTKNHGKCGVCGDPWQGPRDNEAGGKYASGVIVRKYRRGRIFPVIIELTANHGGWFEFRLCPHNRPSTRISQRCLNRFPLRILGDEPFRYTIKTAVSNIAVLLYLQLPYRVICSQCVLQWKYNAGNLINVSMPYPSRGLSPLSCLIYISQYIGDW